MLVEIIIIKEETKEVGSLEKIKRMGQAVDKGQAHGIHKRCFN